MVTSAEELETAQEIISRANLPNPWLNPYYNGKNFSFFRETVFITRDDIGNSRPDQHQVFSRLTVNESDFGRFTLLPDGSIHANLNDPPVGVLGSVQPEEMILKELLDGASWVRTRKNVSPCRDCLYHFLCPPVSSYELLMNRFNFCDVFENPAE
jgi:pseudo-rSAM protein